MSKTVCVYDGREVKRGTPIREDAIIRVIKRVKKALGTYKGNKLVVCEEHLEEYLKKRRQFERNATILVAIFSILVVLYFLSLLSNFTLEGVIGFFGFLVSTMVLLGILIFMSYVPSVEIKEGRKRVKKK